MKKFVAALLMTATAMPALAQASGGVEVKSAYILDDGVVSTPSEVVQAYATIPFAKCLSFNVWGSKGLTTGEGDEVDLGLTCENEFENGYTTKFVVNRYLIRGLPDMWEVTAGVSKGPVDISLSHYTWEEGLEDGLRVQVGYNFELTEKWSGRTELTAETGLELSDALIASSDLSYQLTESVSFTGTIYVPLIEDDFRGVEMLAGLSYSF